MFQKQNFNIILASDGYKITHWKQYPPGTEVVYSYLESRGGRFPSTIFFGLQYYLQRYLRGQVVTQSKINQAEERLAPYIGADNFNRAGWEYILKEHDGRLPVRIRAVPEGTDVPVSNVLMTIENTDPNCFWLTNFLETMLVRVWYPITVATLSNYIRRKLKIYLDNTGDASGLDFMLHDFGYRGVSSEESAGIGGAAHLLNFNGTDTIAGIEFLREYYSPSDDELIGASIPASEHSTITSWGANNELEAMRNMLKAYPTGLVACVSDSYNIWRACSEYWGNQLRMDVLSRDGTLVVRPDSGDPASVDVRCLSLLGEAFGFTTNEKGYKVLHPKVRLIQGDGVSIDSIGEILDAMVFDGWAAENIAFGSGGALLQKLDRDTQKFAFKCSAIRINGDWQDVYKSPITDPGKNSKRGRLRLIKNHGFATAQFSENAEDVLQDVFLNGEIVEENRQPLAAVRQRARAAAENPAAPNPE